ncbi:MAG: hypothetical protein AAF805_12395 [Planctomycetota bacterium]
MLRSRCVLPAAAALIAMTAAATASTIDLGFTDLNLIYDGVDLMDANPDGPDALGAISLNGDALPGPASIDFYLPGVTGLTPGGAAKSAEDGWLEFTLPDGESVTLGLGEVTVNYVDVAGIAQFVFGAAVADVNEATAGAPLPADSEVSVSFSATVSQPESSGGVLAAFVAVATGNVTGAAVVPEPTTAAAVGLLTLFGAAATFMRVRLG